MRATPLPPLRGRVAEIANALCVGGQWISIAGILALGAWAIWDWTPDPLKAVFGP